MGILCAVEGRRGALWGPKLSAICAQLDGVVWGLVVLARHFCQSLRHSDIRMVRTPMLAGHQRVLTIGF